MFDACKTTCVTLNVEVTTVSENVSCSSPVWKSASKLTSWGGVMSIVWLDTCNAAVLDTELTPFPAWSLIASASSEKNVLP